MYKLLLPAKHLTSPVLGVTSLKYGLLILTYSLCFLYLSFYPLLYPTPSIIWPTPEVIQRQRANIVSNLVKSIAQYAPILAEYVHAGTKNISGRGNILPSLPSSSNNEARKPGERVVYTNSLLFSQNSKSGTKIIIVELKDEPAVEVYVKEQQRGEVTKQNSTQAVQLATDKARLQLNQIEKAQLNLGKRLQADFQADILGRTQRVSNSIVIEVEANRVEELRKLPEVKDVHPVQPYYKSNSSAVSLVGAVSAWEQQSGGLALTGEGVKIGVVDSGIDYLHTDFGGPGTPSSYANNNPTIITDTPGVFPGTKVAGGYDFVGDSYDGLNRPQPDPDPMDCGDGHGSHVAGTLAGYGVNSDGTTYTGAYNSSIVSANLSIGPGVAPKAKLYALKVFGCSGSTSSYAIIQALEWSIDPNGDGNFADRLDVLNLSLGSDFGSPYDSTTVAVENVSTLGVIVVTSAGNGGDSNYLISAPGNAKRAISVSSSVDSLSIMGGFRLNFPSNLASIYPASEADFGLNLLTSGPLTGTLAYPNTNPIGCVQFNNSEINSIQGKIVLLIRGGCSFKKKVLNAQEANVSGVLLYDNTIDDPVQLGDDSTITNTINLPIMMTTQQMGNILASRLLNGELINITLSAEYRGKISLVDGTKIDTLSSFSSRGPRMGDAFLKPDLTAPGETIFSTKAGSGTKGVSYSGTSMAAPQVAGGMALLRQLYPRWTVEELKALIMNTASHNLRTERDINSIQYGPARIGAGRLDISKAISSSVIAYNADNSGSVSVSFGELETENILTATKTVRIVNKGSSSIQYKTSYQSFVDMPSVTISTSWSTFEINPGETKLLTVTLTANAQQMKDIRDPSLTMTQTGMLRNWLMEESGYIIFTPLATGVNTLRVPLHAIMRVSSNFFSNLTNLNFDTSAIETQIITVTGQGFILENTLYPTNTTPLVSTFELQYISPNETRSPIQSDSADLKYVGVATDFPVTNAIDDTTIYIGIATHKNWSTPQPLDTQFVVYFDTNNDNIDDYILFNWNLSQINGDNNPSDTFIAYLCPIINNDKCTWKYLNNISPGVKNSYPFNSSVVILPASAKALGLVFGKTRVSYRVLSFQRDFAGQVDASDRLYFDVTKPGLQTNFAAQCFSTGSCITQPEFSGKLLTITYTQVFYRQNNSQGLLLFHHHNHFSSQAEVVKVSQVGSIYSSIPAPGNLINIGTGEVGSLVTTTLTVFQQGTTNLIVNNPLITGDDALEFNIISETFPITLTDVRPRVELTIGCVPTKKGNSKTLLTLTTNDPLLPVASYNLSCLGIDTPKLTTADGNLLWVSPNPQGDMLTDITCPESEKCYALSRSGLLLATVNGGSNWTPQYLEFSDGLSAIACPTVKICFVAGVNGTILTTNNAGSQWKLLNTNSKSSLRDIQCPTTNDCFVTGEETLVSHDGGITWDKFSFSGYKISCPNQFNCFVVEGYLPYSQTHTLIRTSDGGVSWEYLPMSFVDNITDLDCPTSTLCYSVSYTDSTVKISKDGGLTWSQSYNGSDSIVNLTCLSVLLCYGAGQSFLMTQNGGADWITKSLPTYVRGNNYFNFNARNITCSSFDVCYLYNQGSTIIKTENSGNTWITQTFASFDYRDNYCTTQQNCIVFGYTLEGIPQIKKINSESTTVFTFSNTSYLPSSNLSCPTISSCFLILGSSLYLTNDAGYNWITKTIYPQILNSFSSELSCPDTKTCYALFFTDTTRSRVLYHTSDGGTTWFNASLPFIPTYANFSCPIMTSCFIAEKDSANIYITQDNGGTWISKTLSPSVRGIHTIKCVSSTVCYITTSNFYECSESSCYSGAIYKTIDSGFTWITSTVSTHNVGNIGCSTVDNCITTSYVYANPSSATIIGLEIFSTENGGVGWKKSNAWALEVNVNSIRCILNSKNVCTFLGGAAYLTTNNLQSRISLNGQNVNSEVQDVTCLTPLNCIAVGEAGLILVTYDGGQNWQSKISNTEANLYGVGCGVTCVAIGEYGTILVSGDNGETWHPKTSGTNNSLFDVGCGVTCVAVGEYGTILVSSDNGETWQSKTSNTTASLYGVGCGVTCVAVGEYGTILVSGDNGETWHPKTSGTLNTLFDVGCGVTCVAVGDYGTILVSSDNGETWTQQNSKTLSQLKSVSCESKTLCYVVGANGNFFIGSNTGNSSWIAQHSGQPKLLNSVTCNGNACLFGGKSGTLVKWVINGYESIPKPNESLMVGSIQVNAGITSAIIVQSPKYTDLIISNPRITGTNATDFSIKTTGFPVILHPGSKDVDLTIVCSPSAIGLRTATLTLNTSDTTFPNVSYNLKCEGISSQSIVYYSVPQSGAIVDIGKTAIAAEITTTILVGKNGHPNLILSNPVISGSDKTEFAIKHPVFPIIVTNTTSAESILVSCIPQGSGPRSAVLQFNTNDPNQNIVTYSLICYGLRAGYDSTPAPDSEISVGTVSTNEILTATILIREIGNADLFVTNPSIVGLNAADFSVEKSFFPIHIGDGRGGQNLVITCKPTNFGQRIAFLYLTTNDPTRPSIKYKLTCLGVSNKSIIVYKNFDNGNGNIPGTLSYALLEAKANSVIEFILPSNPIIKVTDKLPAIPNGVYLKGVCGNATPKIIIDGSLTPQGTPGLTLKGDVTLWGIEVSRFTGILLKTEGTKNRLSCSKFSSSISNR